MKRELLLGNQAIARGAWEAGVTFASGYPGTPSTEILETLVHYPDVHAQWSANEKVAFEEGMGAALGGLRVLVTMKHVGLNVAADPFMVFPYAGTNGGFVVVSADDPGMHSSQNEQDNRYLARMAKVPVLEPSDAQECKDFVGLALDLSEKFQVPVMLRTTTRLAHHKGLVTLGERQEVPRREFAPDPRRLSVPIYRRLLRPKVEQRLAELREYAETTPVNRVEPGDRMMGVVTSGISYAYVREVLPQASVLRLGMTHPLPAKMLTDFCANHGVVYVVEEGEPFIEEFMRSLGIKNLEGKERFGVIGEYSPIRLGVALGLASPPDDFGKEISVLPRPPMFCIGCGHRTVFSTLRQLKVTVAGDIGCYTMGALPPYEASHTTFCMGASIGTAFGLERAGHERVVAVIGDSTFVHAGIPALIDAVYNGSQMTLVILDNSTTGMTGGQPHPAAGKRLDGQPAPRLDLAALCRTVGVERVETVDTWNRKAVGGAIRSALAHPGPAVVIAQGMCQQLPEMKHASRVPFYVDEGLCTKCEACFKVWCPAIVRTAEGFPFIKSDECTSCTVCAQVCPTDAIYLQGEPERLTV
ncbi:MAG TPA: thiamine pyrophosphate-dependent enzyme [Anaerolineales bacterium]|nr:thiamine pyrophosphate-dependent enzyme [Anaerolineales bacterium]